jgi:putative peptide zinc metalloprotease protein
MKRLLLIVAALLAALGLAGFRPDAASAQDTAAVAVNTKDGSSIFKLAFAIKRAAGDVVDNANAAVAISSCTECRTVAISIQIVLVTGDPEVVTPQNIALAYNVECTSCETFASAYQYVLGTDGNVRFTPEGRHEIQEIRRELRDLARAGLPLTELDTRLNALMQRLARLLRNELVEAGKPYREETEGEEDTRAPPTTTTAPADTTATTPTTTETTPTTGTDTTTTATTPTP